MTVTGDTIGIYILSSHENYFLNILQILGDHDGEVILFTEKDYMHKISDKNIDSEQYSWVARSESEPLSSFLSRASEIWNERVDTLISFPFYGDVWILNEYYKTEFECTHIQMIYNINMWAGTDLRFTPRVDKYLGILLRTQMLSRVDGVIVEYTPMKEYLETVSSVQNSAAFAPILFEGTDYTDTTPRLTIPGHIEPERRNYEFFINVLESHLQDYRDELEVYLLGSPSNSAGEEIVNQCDRLNDEGWNIEYYNDWVPVEDFERVLKMSDLLVSPMNRYKTRDAVTEIYGRSKGSGAFGDAIKYGKPLALPSHYEVPPETDPIVRMYDDEKGLAGIVRSSLNSGGLSESELDQLEEQFSLEKQRERFYNILSRFRQTESV